ncbi:hypothetical protein [Paenibacillus lautus]
MSLDKNIVPFKVANLAAIFLSIQFHVPSRGQELDCRNGVAAQREAEDVEPINVHITRHDLFTNAMGSHNKVLLSNKIIKVYKRNQINLSKLMSFEETIIRVINGGELSLLYDLIEEYFNLNDNEVWKRWSVYVEELLDFLDNMTFSKQQEQAREDLKFAYYVEYQRHANMSSLLSH